MHHHTATHATSYHIHPHVANTTNTDRHTPQSNPHTTSSPAFLPHPDPLFPFLCPSQFPHRSSSSSGSRTVFASLNSFSQRDACCWSTCTSGGANAGASTKLASGLSVNLRTMYRKGYQREHNNNNKAKKGNVRDDRRVTDMSDLLSLPLSAVLA